MFHMSGVRYPVSGVKFQLLFFCLKKCKKLKKSKSKINIQKKKSDKAVDLFSGGFVIKGANPSSFHEAYYTELKLAVPE